MQDRPTFGVLSNQVFVTRDRLQTQPKTFQKLNLERNNQFFGLWKNTYHTIFIYGKMFIIEISYNVLYVWHCMELYDKKFFINGNCMIRSFGQPGHVCTTVCVKNTVSQTCPMSSRRLLTQRFFAFPMIF